MYDCAACRTPLTNGTPWLGAECVFTNGCWLLLAVLLQAHGDGDVSAFL
jgi:hypothetical protein